MIGNYYIMHFNDECNGFFFPENDLDDRVRRLSTNTIYLDPIQSSSANRKTVSLSSLQNVWETNSCTFTQSFSFTFRLSLTLPLSLSISLSFSLSFYLSLSFSLSLSLSVDFMSICTEILFWCWHSIWYFHYMIPLKFPQYWLVVPGHCK